MDVIQRPAVLISPPLLPLFSTVHVLTFKTAKTKYTDLRKNGFSEHIPLPNQMSQNSAKKKDNAGAFLCIYVFYGKIYELLLRIHE